MNKWKTLASRYAHTNAYYAVREDRVMRPDGTEGTYHVIESAPGVAVIVVREDKRLLLQKVFRYTTQLEGWEIILGGCDRNEDPLIAAKRELLEETGYKAAHWEHLGKGQGWNSKAASMADSYICHTLTRVREVNNAREGQLEVKAFTITEVSRMITEHLITDYKTLASLMMAIAAHKL